MTIQTGSSGARNHHRDFKTPTHKQMTALIRYTEDGSVPAPVRAGITAYIETGQMTYSVAWDTIAMIKAYQESREQTQKPIEKLGIYVDPKTDAFYLVKKSQVGRLYAMELVLDNLGEKNPDGTWKVKPEFRWEFQAGRGTIHKLSADWYATPEQLKAWGDLTGHCVKCGKELTVQKSIDQGMGDTCWNKQFA